MRARSGEMMIPESAMERLAGGPLDAQTLGLGSILPDHCLGIEQRPSGLKRNGEHQPYYRICGSDEHFSEAETTAIAPLSVRLQGKWNRWRI